MKAGLPDLTRVHEVAAVRFLENRGPWRTKSQADLTVVFAMDFADVMHRFFAYQEVETKRMPPDFDVRGLRMYMVRGIPAGTIGGTEFHRIREEMVFCLDGAVRWVCEDLSGGKREFLLKPHQGVWMPPYILHTYSAKEDGSGLLVLCNTLFDPDDPQTHDTYAEAEFRALQKRYR